MDKINLGTLTPAEYLIYVKGYKDGMLQCVNSTRDILLDVDKYQLEIKSQLNIEKVLTNGN